LRGKRLYHLIETGGEIDMRQRPALDVVVSYLFLRCGGEAERSIARERVKAAVNQEGGVVVITAERQVHG
jgi:hypothetical protein